MFSRNAIPFEDIRCEMYCFENLNNTSCAKTFLLNKTTDSSIKV